MNSGNTGPCQKGYPWRAVENCEELLEHGQRPRAVLCFKQLAGNLDQVAQMCQDQVTRHTLTDLANRIKERASSIVNSLNPDGENIATFHIEEGAIGFGYDRIFGPYLNDPNITEVIVEEPYIMAEHQIRNFIWFCELVVAHCTHLRKIHLTTKYESVSRYGYVFGTLRDQLQQRNIIFDINTERVHDRMIHFNNGFVFEIGFGLDYFQRPTSDWGIGKYDYNFRSCKKCTIRISYLKPH